MSDFGSMKNEKDKWSNLVCQTISTLCRNGMIGCDVIKVQGLIGITLCNQEVFLVEISESFEAQMLPQSEGSISSQKMKSRKRKNSHPRSSRVPDETISQDGESNEADYDQPPAIFQPNLQEARYSNNLPASHGHFYGKDYYIEHDREKIELRPFEPREDESLAMSDFSSLVADDNSMQKEVASPRKFRVRRELAHGVAMTKHTAELLGYQDFSPSSSRPYSCRLCEASFSKKFCLANHIVTVHQVGGKYICEHCGRQFLQRNRYMLHLDRHNDASKLVCSNCGKTTLKSNYETHLRKCSGGQGRREVGLDQGQFEPDDLDGGDSEEPGVMFEMPGFLPDMKIKHEEFDGEMD